MKKHLHLLFKCQREVSIFGCKINTIRGHKQIFEEKNRLIWGQFSNSNQKTEEKKGVADRNRERITGQINTDIESFAFFLMNNGRERELFVGKIDRLYDRKEIKSNLIVH
ncbi:hypothetical protein [Bacillus mycoides]|uniref:hypothetical protein n=1 Tax=Bacillus mycoides TaxID=1405 RepID=UPI0035565599